MDYRDLNWLTYKDCYPILLLNDLLDAPRKAWVYSKTDLKNAYYLVYIAEGDEWKTAFCTQYSSFEWLVIPFGLLNAPAAFQCFINEVFVDLLNVYVVIYLDNILIYSDNLEDHIKHVKEILKKLWRNKLYASPTKCAFHRNRIEFLGYILGANGLRIDNSKIWTIQDWLVPHWVKDMQSFLGFTNFYRWFISNYVELISLLTGLTHKNEPWNWITNCQLAFNTLKEAFTTVPIVFAKLSGN